MHRINHYPLESAVVSPILIGEIVIYQVDSAIQLLSNWGLKDLKPKKGGASPYRTSLGVPPLVTLFSRGNFFPCKRWPKRATNSVLCLPE